MSESRKKDKDVSLEQRQHRLRFGPDNLELELCNLSETFE